MAVVEAINLEPVACEALHAVVDREDVDPFAVLDVRRSGQLWIATTTPEANTQVISHHTVHSNLLVAHRVVRQHDT